MRAVVFACFAVVLLGAGSGCAYRGRVAASGESGPRSIPHSALVQRAWAGREPPTTTRAAWVVWFAASQVGKEYCWGGTGPGCFDCSGLVQRAWGSVGIRVPRTSEAIAEQLPEVRIEDVRTGDILWWPGHVGIYAGNGWVIDALGEKWGVVRRAATDPHRAFRPQAEWAWPNEGMARAY